MKPSKINTDASIWHKITRPEARRLNVFFFYLFLSSSHIIGPEKVIQRHNLRGLGDCLQLRDIGNQRVSGGHEQSVIYFRWSKAKKGWEPLT